MRAKGKITYEKPTAVSLGPAGSIRGQVDCGPGSSAAGGTCTGGDDVLSMPYCEDGNIATGDCETSGSSAGRTCFATGNTAGWGCGAGGFPAFG